MDAMRTLIFACFSLALVAGCGRPFDVKTAPGFVELDNQEASSYDYRATSPEGVVFSVKHVDYPEEKGDIAFWTRAVTLQMRDVTGYALLDTKDATALGGTKGKALTFGHDEDGKPYIYLVTIYMRGDRLFIVEAGGTRAQMERFGPSIDWMEKSVRVDCSIFLSPVLASRTCNRW